MHLAEGPSSRSHHSDGDLMRREEGPECLKKYLQSFYQPELAMIIAPPCGEKPDVMIIIISQLDFVWALGYYDWFRSHMLAHTAAEYLGLAHIRDTPPPPASMAACMELIIDQ